MPSIPSKPKRYYLPLSLSYDDAQQRCKRWQNDIRQQLQESNITDLQYFDAELFPHNATLHPTISPQSFSGNQQIHSLSQKETSCSTLISSSNSMKQTGSISKQILPQQLSKLSESSTITSNNGEQISQKCNNERSKNIKSRKISKIFHATKHISLLSSSSSSSLSPRHDTDNNEIDMIHANYQSMDSGIKSPTIRYSTHSTEQRLKTTLITSAEKMKNVFCKPTKLIENPTIIKDHKSTETLQHPMNYFTDDGSDVSYV